MTNQQIFNFNNSTSYLEEDFVKDISNQAAVDFLNKFPSWETKLINIFGDQMCGKTFLINIFKKKNNFYYVNDEIDFETKFDELFNKEKLIIDSIDVDDEKMFSLINHFILHKKYLIILSRKPITQMDTKLHDLNSRFKQFYIIEIGNPSDQLIYSLILKFFSDNQVIIKKELVQHIVKKIGRSYVRINQFLSTLNNMSIAKQKKIDFKLINEVTNLIF